MEPKDLINERMHSVLANIHTELVQIRQQAQRQFADNWEVVDEYGVGIATGAPISLGGLKPVMGAFKSTPVVIDFIFIYTSGDGTTTLKLNGLHDYGVPVPVGITRIGPIHKIYQPGERPLLINETTTTTNYIHVWGHALPSVMDPV